MKYKHYIKRVINKLTSISVKLKAHAVQGFRIANLNIISISYLFFFLLGFLISCYVNNMIFSSAVICYIPYNIDIPTLGHIKPIFSFWELRYLSFPPISTIFEFHYYNLTITQPYWDINLNNSDLCDWIRKVYFVVNGKYIFLTDISSLKLYYALSTKEQLAYFQTWSNVYVIYNQYLLLYS
jgi:hypothetical protein